MIVYHGSLPRTITHLKRIPKAAPDCHLLSSYRREKNWKRHKRKFQYSKILLRKIAVPFMLSLLIESSRVNYIYTPSIQIAFVLV